MKATETIIVREIDTGWIEGVPCGVDALCDYVLSRYPSILARLGEGWP